MKKNISLFRKEVLDMVSLRNHIENNITISLVDFLKGINKEKVFVHSHYRSYPKRKR